MSTVTHNRAIRELVRRAYGDCNGLPCRLLHFHTEGHKDFAEVADCLAIIGGYNAFQAGRVIEALRPVFPRLSSVEIGREGSPVIYAYVPHWTHQAIGHEGYGMGEPLSDEARREIGADFIEAMRKARADELSVDEPDGHRWITSRADMRSLPHAPYKMRAWWD